ncbi:carbohydrate ABC transporter membrane protein 2, CUT1 family [Tranquillimonas rosea]|uniref:Carbohydrate ABC transporter membrane protein 2, CUT1 family n=1 Tax=Tranquillimonas rosea TaxID=641238 RepID=A0A1H9WLG4_9RHOB|nr:carbohydrate ABC transporter permease [Tranquillimonas rosea]SES34730.1 carbohydrate ABC transporter membrane protein 2, CUT1 family [Tranquillimonas rosea]
MSPRAADIATYVAAILLAALFLAPLTWLVSLALRMPQEVYLGAARFVPESPTLDNFVQILTDRAFGSYLWNAVKLCALGAFGAVVVATPAAYAFSRMRFRGRLPLMLAILLVQMISPLVVLIPLYRYMDRIGLLDTHLSVIGVYMALGVPLAVWLLKAAFDTIPPSLEEAAAIDGCSRPEILLRITLPLAAPGLASAFILNMIMGWSQFLVPFILLTGDGKLPISVAIFNFAGSTSASTTQLLAAACLVAVVPALACFVALQRMIVRAITAGAVKG